MVLVLKLFKTLGVKVFGEVDDGDVEREVRPGRGMPCSRSRGRPTAGPVADPTAAPL
jgi:hypothetical protein